MEENKVDVKSNENSSKQNNSIKKISTTKITMLILFALVVIISVAIIVIRNDFLTVISVGTDYKSIFDINIDTKERVFGVAFISIFFYILVLNFFTKLGLKKFFNEDKVKMPKLPNISLAMILALIGGIAAIFMLSDKYLLFSNEAVFGRTDPVFNLDISYYMFTLPFVDSLLIYIGEVLAVSLVYVAIYYVITLNTCLDGVEVETLKKNMFLKQIYFIVTMIVIVTCTYVYINAQDILTGDMVKISDPKGTYLNGAGLTDSTIKVWGYRVLSVIIFVASMRILGCIKKSNFKGGMIAVLTIPVYFMFLGIVMIYFQTVHVGNNELDSEQEYIAYNIKNTKSAYGIDIEQENISSYKEISSSELQEYTALINNIPIISEDTIKTSILEHQENTAYYKYENTFLAIYKINNANKLVYITPREILNDASVTFNKKTYTNTHGYSMVVNSVNDSDGDGYSEYLLSDFTTEDILKISEPRIYFGLSTNSPILVNTRFGKEYDYPITASTNEENIYVGEAGINANFLNRIVVGLANKSIKLAFASKNYDNTKLVINRNIIKRAKSILPNVLFDENPYLVIKEDGKLAWVIDGYTYSNAYPYSQKTKVNINGDKVELNYIRNSLKVIIDAYDGTTDFYITDKTDPIIMTYRNIYPDLFIEEDMPEDIKTHLVYPKFLYNIQSEMIDVYHDISEDTLYRADDLWQISNKPAASTNSTIMGEKMEPYYTVVKTKDSSKVELGLVVTYNRYEKQNISSYLVGKVVDGKSKLSLYKFNSENNVVGMIQLSNQIDQDATISKELSDINSTGIKLVKDMIIVPVNNSLLYIEPIYQVMLNESEIPVLRKVIVASGTKVAIGDTLQAALNNLVTDDNSIDIDFTDTENIEGLIDSIIKANTNLTTSLESNNFELIGKDITNLQGLIKQLEEKRESEKQKAEQENNPDLMDEVKDMDSLVGDTNTITNTILKR